MIVPNLPAQVAGTIRKYKLLNPGDTVIVALSGGADSTALLDILAGLSEFKLRVVVAHLNHCLRGEASDEDEKFSRALAQKYAFTFESRRIDIYKFAGQNRLNLEDAGRRARIAFFEEIRTREQATAIALAHHADDQAETVLMHLLRGSGATGLAGMPYKNGRGHIRPLLNITRPEIEVYLKERGLTWREDASNNDTAFLRNRIRHELLPALECYNPAIRSSLATTASLLADENDLLERLATESAAQICVFDVDRVSCSIKALAEQPAALRRRIFRQTLKQLTGTLFHVTHSHIKALEHLATFSRPNATLNLALGVTALREYDLLTVRRTFTAATPEMSELIIREPGFYSFSDGSSLVIESFPVPESVTSLPNGLALFDLDKAPFPWLVRTFRAGDRIRPHGMSGTKKVKNLFIDLKIPSARRRQIPLIFSSDTLIWVCGLRTSDCSRMDTSSTSIVSAIFSKA